MKTRLGWTVEAGVVGVGAAVVLGQATGPTTAPRRRLPRLRRRRRGGRCR